MIKPSDHIMHDIIVYTVNYVIVPILVVIVLYLNHKYSALHGLYTRIKHKIMGLIVGIEFNYILDKRKHGNFNQTLITNAINEVRSSEIVTMKNALKQLIHYHKEDRVLRDIIGILATETDFHRICLLVCTLKEICDKRLENE